MAKLLCKKKGGSKKEGRKEGRKREVERKSRAPDIMSLLWKKLRAAGSSAASHHIYMLLQLPLPTVVAPFVARQISRRPLTHNTDTSLSQNKQAWRFFMAAATGRKQLFFPSSSAPWQVRWAETTTEDCVAGFLRSSTMMDFF